MRKPVTQEQLDRVEVTPEDEAAFKRGMDRLLEAVGRSTLGHRPIAGIALLRAALQGASLMGLPHEDLARVVGYALNTFPARGQPVRPTDAELDDVYPFVKQAHLIASSCFRHEPATDLVGIELWCAVAILRFHGAPDATVYKLFTASVVDADRATAGFVQAQGNKA